MSTLRVVRNKKFLTLLEPRDFQKRKAAPSLTVPQEVEKAREGVSYPADAVSARTRLNVPVADAFPCLYRAARPSSVARYQT